MFKNFYNFNIKKLMRIRLHLGHDHAVLNEKLTSYIYGIRHNVDIYDLNKLWKPYRYLFSTLVHHFSKRCTFFIIGINPNIIGMSIFLKNLFEKYKYYPFWKKNDSAQVVERKINFLKPFYILGYIDQKWLKGFWTNWKIFQIFVEYVNNPFKKFKKKYRFFRYFPYLDGVRVLVEKPIPDFILFLDKDKEAMYELKKFQIPMIGLVDTDINPESFLFKFWSNNDSLENIYFFFEFIQEAIKEGRLKEQQLFFLYFVQKLKKKIM